MRSKHEIERAHDTLVKYLDNAMYPGEADKKRAEAALATLCWILEHEAGLPLGEHIAAIADAQRQATESAREAYHDAYREALREHIEATDKHVTEARAAMAAWLRASRQ